MTDFGASHGAMIKAISTTSQTLRTSSWAQAGLLSSASVTGASGTISTTEGTPLLILAGTVLRRLLIFGNLAADMLAEMLLTYKGKGYRK